MGNLPTKSLSYSTIRDIFNWEHPEYECRVKKILPTEKPNILHLILSNGDEYDYTIESVQTNLKKAEAKYILAQSIDKDKVLGAFCGTKTLLDCRCCILNQSDGCIKRRDPDEAIRLLIKAGVIKKERLAKLLEHGWISEVEVKE